MPSPLLITSAEFIAPFEGFSAHGYRCPAGYLTFGYGSRVDYYPDVPFPISQEAAMEYLMQDCTRAWRAVQRLIRVPLQTSQASALISFVHNLGAGRLQASTLRRVINAHHHEAAPAEFRKWVYADGRKLQGLVKRRAAEANLYQNALPN